MHSIHKDHPDTAVRGDPGEPKEGPSHKAGHKEAHPKDADPAKHGHEDNRKLKELEQKLKETEARYEEMLDTARRMKAEYENSRKRSELQYLERLENEKVSIMKEFILVCDNLDRAAASPSSGEGRDEWKKGLDMVLKQFKSVLTRFGVSEIDPMNAAFDPNEHEALLVSENTDVRHETVAAVLEKGYRLNSKIIRHAKVRVDKPPAGPAQENEKTSEIPVPGQGDQEDPNG